jgi:ribosomal protein S18 acetylase RimI-like enzyme
MKFNYEIYTNIEKIKKYIDDMVEIDEKCFNKTDAFDEDDFSDMLNESKFYVVLCRESKSNEIAGYGLYTVSKNIATLESIAVLHDYRGNGIAGEILSLMEKRLMKDEIGIYNAITRMYNINAINLQFKYGASINTTLNSYYDDEDGFMFVKFLTKNSK